MEASLETKPRASFEFEVEKVIGVSDDGRYLVKWTPTWVSRFHLVGCEKLIQEFLHQQAGNSEIPESETETTEKAQCVTSLVGNEKETTNCERNVTMADTEQEEQNSPDPAVCIIKVEDRDESEKCAYVETTIGDLHDVGTVTTDRQDEQHTSQQSLKGTVLDTGPSTKIFLKYTSEHLLSEDRNQDQSPSLSHQIHEPHENLVFVHPNTTSITTCHICNEELPTENDLRIHIKTHQESEEKQHTCPYCDKKFRVKCNLTTHLRTHTGEQPYKCDFCEYSCSFKGNLKVHMRIHTGERPYNCQLCGKTFAQSGTLKKHVARCARARKKKGLAGGLVAEDVL